MTRTLPGVATAPTDPPTGLRSALLLAVLLLGQFMAVLDGSIVNVAVPTIRDSLHADGSALQLVVSGYVISYAVLLVTGARLGDRLGQRRTFLLGSALFTVSSLACGLAWNPISLIVFRFIQGAGAAALVPQVVTLLQHNFTGSARIRALSLFAAVASGATIVGQIAGGLIVDCDFAGTGWRGVFLVNVPIGTLLLASTLCVVPAIAPTRPRRLDPAGLATLTPAVLLLVLPLVLGHEQHWPAWTWYAFLSAAACFACFAWVERRAHRNGGEPLFALRVLRAPGMAPAGVTLLLVMAMFSGWMFVTAIYLQTTLGYSALHAGLVFLPCGAVFALTSMTWSRLPQRWQGFLVPAGLVVAGTAIGALGRLLGDGRRIGAAEVVLLGFLGAGFALAYGPSMTRSLAKVPPERAADASGLLVTCSQLGMVTGVATFGSVFLAVFGTTVATAAHAVALTAAVEAVCAVVIAGPAVFARSSYRRTPRGPFGRARRPSRIRDSAEHRG
ncbi:MFS transporter [Nocardia kruczakiae]|uniref:MFS transporter n=1 Tax=Nocardia kruczakiae TaxID=261477 RepID=UPI000A8EBD77|nr:MFS transporter [Nocardia kruczakiae]